MKTIFLVFLLFIASVSFCQTDSTDRVDTVPRFFVLIPKSDTTFPYSLGQHLGYVLLMKNHKAKDGCGNDILETIDMEIYLDEKKRPVDWTKYDRIEKKLL
jgi:hypothetical protein